MPLYSIPTVVDSWSIPLKPTMIMSYNLNLHMDSFFYKRAFERIFKELDKCEIPL